MDKITLNSNDIKKVICNKYPFLFVDFADNISPGLSAVGYKNLTVNDWFFQNHFEDNYVMPGVLIVEAMSQTASLAIATLKECENKVIKLAKISQVKFYAEVIPGDQLVMEASVLSWRRGVAKSIIKSYVKGALVTEAELLLIVKDLMMSSK